MNAGTAGQATVVALVALLLGWELRRWYVRWSDARWIRRLVRDARPREGVWYPPIAAGDHELTDGHG